MPINHCTQNRALILAALQKSALRVTLLIKKWPALLSRLNGNRCKSPQYAAILIVLMLITSCGTQPYYYPTTTTQVEPTDSEQGNINREQRSLETLLTQIKYQDSEQAQLLILPALLAAVNEQQWPIASRITELTEPEQYSQEDFSDWSIAALRTFMQTQQLTKAEYWVNHPLMLQRIALMPLDKQITLSLVRADILHAIGHHLASAQERIYIEPLLKSQTEKNDNSNGIWSSLVRVPKSVLALQHSRTSNLPYKAWLELALIHQGNQIDISQQAQNTAAWRQRWSESDSLPVLPNAISLLQTLPANRPRSVAVMLPLTGSLADAGKAVVEGLTAAYFTAKQQGWDVPTITTYDTHRNSMNTLYQQALIDGADFIIGPLQKSKVIELFTIETQLPILTLNYVTNGMPPPRNITQFGLAAEDEARQLALEVWREKHNNIIVLRSDTDWAKRAAETFSQYWSEYGGQLAGTTVLTSAENFSAETAAGLLLTQSEERNRQLENIFGTRMEFTPRRRSDVDAILLLTNSAQAKSLKPLISYHYANDLPVFSSSRVNDGDKNRNSNADLNGIIFNETPWILEQHEIKQQANSMYQNNKQLGQLFAMGIDVFYLHPRLEQLGQSPSTRVQGMTGRLALQDRRITRELTMALFEKGQAKKRPQRKNKLRLN